MDFVSKDKRSTIMKSIRSSNTKPEISLRKFLFSNGIRYRINYEKLPGRPDIVFMKYPEGASRDADFVRKNFRTARIASAELRRAGQGLTTPLSEQDSGQEGGTALVPEQEPAQRPVRVSEDVAESPQPTYAL